MGTALAVDGFVIETVKPDAKHLQGQDVACYRNRKEVWGLISQVGCDANAKTRFVQTDWPGATNDLSCFRETPLFLMLNRQLPHWVHIVADEAYSSLSAECNGQILTPYSHTSSILQSRMIGRIYRTGKTVWLKILILVWINQWRSTGS